MDDEHVPCCVQVWLLLARTVQTCRFGAREASFWSLAVTGDVPSRLGNHFPFGEAVDSE